QPVSPPGGPTGTVSTSISISAPTITGDANAPVTVAVSAGSGTPTGTVSLVVDNGAPLTATLANGQVTFTLLSPGIGDHSLSATYAGQGTFGGSSTSATLPVDAHPTAGNHAVPFARSTYGAAGTLTRVVIDVVRQDSSKGWATVHYSTSNGTAKAGTDYRKTAGTLTFKPGATKRSFVVQLLSNGSGGPKTVNLTLSDAKGASLGSQSTAVLTMSSGRGSTIRATQHGPADAKAGDSGE